MFRIDNSLNRISKIPRAKFAELGFTERNHLQEWIANQPDALGEELLIIQKEFDGFDDTRERLDLLAIDKSGALVVIENKLDDSGRDVVWQCLKYASYCSTLSKTQVAEIYQRYLDKANSGHDARKAICDFLGQESFEDVVLNSGNDQRLIMVAANFRKEVTSTVLWLLKHKVYVKCFRATPYQDGNSLLLNIEQVIPLPEAEELMIGISEKESEELSTERVQAARYVLRTEFWHRTLEALDKAGVDLYSNVGPSRDHWLNAGSGLSGVPYTMIFNKDEARVELTIARATKAANKAVFDALFTQRDKIENAFGARLEWRRNDEKKSSALAYGKDFDGHNKSSWPEMTDWLVVHMAKLERAISPFIPSLRTMVHHLDVKEGVESGDVSTEAQASS
ncbi:DUF4268 domain-containing protein [Lysobacter sp. A6]|uniref:DUF4268 domain-containing protein n=1 Tax=Noviluteimonas lactosilytica TaxID=2888523 RepID=A0ABS8JJR4_9GAMM|nr:DUF4268 domain-containing protein [Lysobacter lactosilyticus]MCC8363841.1 DUF4268 domain-containing protein [Lysobacter lactosilyticus]